MIIPVPKKPQPIEHNDYACGINISSDMEKYVVSKLKADVSSKLDPLQFA